MALPAPRPLRTGNVVALPARRRDAKPVPVLAPRELARLATALDRLLASDAREPHLAGALAAASAAATAGGSLVRPQLALALGLGHGVPRAVATRLAAAVEAFHTASLVFDDLPAMDDARERRGRTCPHVEWGEGAAILAGLALVTRGYALLGEALAGVPARRRRRVDALVAECLGAAGILDGQARDLHFRGGTAAALAAARGKTAPLLRLAVRLPLEVAGRSRTTAATARHLDRLAASWGLAYQVLDDLADRTPGLATGKTAGRDAILGRPNVVGNAGAPAAARILARRLASAERRIAALAAIPGDWSALARVQALLAGKAERLSIARAAGARRAVASQAAR